MRRILYPFSIIYGAILWIRRKCYEKGIFSSRTFSTPTICIGNLAVGGTGKTPHTEFIIRKLQDAHIALLSRGYKRETRGAICSCQLPKNEQNARILGDEPAQYLKKFPNLPVTVAEKRAEGMELLQKNFPNLDLVILDDAYQHLAVNYNCKILLTEYNRLYTDDCPFPAGNLREFPSAAKYADLIVVTKTPETLSEDERAQIARKLKIKNSQELFFTKIAYNALTPCSPRYEQLEPNSETEILLVTAIANYLPLLQHLEKRFSKVHLTTFQDHHFFSDSDIETIISQFNQIKTTNKIVITTEKDIPRFECASKNIISLLPVFVAPIEVEFLFNEDKFCSIIKSYVRKS